MTKTQTKYRTKTQENYQEVNRCPHCGSLNLIRDYDRGETVCGSCGWVIQEKIIDEGPEWRSFTPEEKIEKSRVGIPSSYSVHDKGLSTTISRVNRDAYGRKLPYPAKLQMWRLRKWQKRSRVHSSIERNLAQAMSEIDRISQKTYIPPHIKERASVIYRKALDKGIIRGRSIASVAAAAVYAACRGSGTPRTLREIAETSLVDKKDVARSYRLLLRELEIKMPVPNQLTYLSKIAETIGISGEIQGIAVRILREAKEKSKEFYGKAPQAIAAAALYIACQKRNEGIKTHRGERKVTQKDIAKAPGVTEVTLRNRYKGLVKALEIDLFS